MMAPAKFARGQGWKVGSVIFGHPIILNGSEIECSRTVIITAIGQECVLGITQIDGDDRWSIEHLINFSARKWEVSS